MNKCYQLFLERLELELAVYHGVQGQPEYLGRGKPPKRAQVSAIRVSGGCHPLGSPESRGWRQVSKRFQELFYLRRADKD